MWKTREEQMTQKVRKDGKCPGLKDRCYRRVWKRKKGREKCTASTFV
jgi:hypothetical protein